MEETPTPLIGLKALLQNMCSSKEEFDQVWTVIMTAFDLGREQGRLETSIR